MQQKVNSIIEILKAHYPDALCALQYEKDYELMIAVRLSAQCTDARVNKVTPALFDAAPTPEKMASMTWQQVREYIATCGLTETKARRLVATAQQLVELHGGQVPDSFDELEALPGVGHKTASVVMAQAFGHPAFPVDTHIFRLARRWGLSRGKTVEKVEADLKKLFPRAEWNRLHVQFVLWGREHCPARGCRPTCDICSRLGVNSTR